MEHKRIEKQFFDRMNLIKDEIILINGNNTEINEEKDAISR
jgi:hypothetical protein